MRVSIRSHATFVIGLFVAAFGAGQLWSLALSLRGHSTGFWDMTTGVLGFLMLMVAGLVVGRMLYLQAHVSRLYQAQTQEVNNDIRK